jgi:hypothetical protein
MTTSLTWIPPVTCSCGERHHLGAKYYVSVMDGSRQINALGPFRTHQEALAWVPIVNREVIDHYNPEGRAHFYAYGTVAMAHDYQVPGRLNGEFPSAPVLQ